MNALGFYWMVFMVRSLAILPLPVLYVLADLLYPLAYYIIRYRRRIVHKNLLLAFPEKSEDERRMTEKKFYRHFGDLLVETIKLAHSGKWETAGHIRYRNPEVLEEFYKQGKQVIVATAHYGNWEWLSLLAAHSPFKNLSIYKPLNNQRFNGFMKSIREKHGAQMVPMRGTLRTLLQMKKDCVPVLACFISDQSPVWEETQYWTEFLNQDTAVYLGVEKMAIKLGSPIVFYRNIKVRRGRYEVEIIPLIADPSAAKPQEITDRYFQCLEQIIMQQPEYWLWTHNRWKLTEKKNRLAQSGY